MQLSLSQTPKSISSANYLLRQYGGAAAAYSLQRLDTSTTNVVRARRSTDDAESNFTAEEVSGGTLREFALNNDADIIRFANQAAAADKRMYFDGSNDYVTTSYAADGTSDFFVEAKFSIESIGSNQMLLDDRGTERLVQLFVNNSGKLQSTVWTSSGIQVAATGATTLSVGVVYTARLVHDVSESRMTILLDGESDGTGTYTGTWTPANLNGVAIGASTSGIDRLSGIIYDVNLNDESTYNGYGNTNADWTDQVGSNDGTVNGSPALFSGQGFNAYVTTLYDQSGNGRDATQATAASQPQIVADGVVVTDANGNPSMDFDGSDDELVTASAAISTQTHFVIADSDDAAKVQQTLFRFTNPTTIARYETSNIRHFHNSVYSTAAATTPASLLLISGYFGDTNDSKVYANGSEIGGDATGSWTSPASGTLHLGALSGTEEFDGKLSEFVFYGSDQSSNRAAIEANIASRYGITLA